MFKHPRLNLNLNTLARPLQHHQHPPMRTGMSGTQLLKATGTERPVHKANGFLTDNPEWHPDWLAILFLALTCISS